MTARLGASSATAQVDVIATGSAGLVINELDYDNPGDDTLEFIEILNTTELPVNLAGLAVVLVNGGNDTEYRRIALGGTLTAGAYLVLGSQALLDSLPAGVPAIALPLAKDNLQNGSPDAVGLLDTASGELLDALSYEGSITAGVLTGVADPLDFVEGTPTEAKDTNSAQGCLARLPDGQDTDDASADWFFTTRPTPGAPNLP